MTEQDYIGKSQQELRVLLIEATEKLAQKQKELDEINAKLEELQRTES